MQVPMYAKYIKDILGNKRTLSTTEVVQLTEECSAAIFDPLLVKKKHPGCSTISCSIGAQHFSNALYDLGASVSVMPKIVYDEVQEETVESNTSATQEDPVEPPRTSRDYHDTTALPFPERIRKLVADEQFGKFVEVIKKLYVNTPLLDAM